MKKKAKSSSLREQYTELNIALIGIHTMLQKLYSKAPGSEYEAMLKKMYFDFDRTLRKTLLKLSKHSPPGD